MSIHTKRAAFVIALLLAFLVLRPAAEAQWIPTPYFTTFVPPTDISFTLTTDRASYGSDEPIPMKYEIAYVGSRPVFVPQHMWEEALCPAPVHVDAWFESADGHYGGGWSRGQSCGTRQLTVTQRMTSGAVLLKPGDHAEG